MRKSKYTVTLTDDRRSFLEGLIRLHDPTCLLPAPGRCIKPLRDKHFADVEHGEGVTPDNIGNLRIGFFGPPETPR
jgi:hypothetical protein